jgi:hypothetical protein
MQKSTIKKENYKNIMIVSHTDDELLWGWKELKNKEDWLVICIFQQYNFPNSEIERKRRFLNFEKTSNVYNFDYVIFEYIDNPYNLEVNNDIQEKIKLDIKKYINSNVNMILTHNPHGEYGHYHHKITSKIVTEMIIDKDKLYYFSFNINKYEEFDEKYLECFYGYFSHCLNDLTVIGHRKLSNISEIIHCKNYKYDYELIKNKYPEFFLNCNLLTYNKFLY